MCPEYDVEEIDRRCLRKAIKEVANDKKPNSHELMERLYHNTYLRVERIIKDNGQEHFEDMMRAAQVAIKEEKDRRALSTTRGVVELLDTLHVKSRWENTDLLEYIVDCLPERPRTLSASLLERYNSLLNVFNREVSMQDSIAMEVAEPEVTRAQIHVEITVANNLRDFFRMECCEMLYLIVHQPWRIPCINVKVTAIKPGSTTVVLRIDEAFMENIIRYSVEASALWAFQELRVTRVRVGAFELNVVQLLTQHFKEALHSGLTSGMDFVGAVKVCGICELVICYFMVLPHSTCNLYTTSVL